MKSLISAACLASLLSFSSAAPNPQYGIPTSGVLKPIVRSQYEVWTGAVHYNTPTGHIFKNGRTTDITTLLIFDIPATLSGKTCEFHLYLDPSATVSGTGAFDVFSSLAPATQDTTTWPSGNLRDQYGGRMQAHISGEATWVPDIVAEGKAFPCPAVPMKYAAELVGTGDVDNIAWNSAAGSGSYIKYY
jgi:hypothetical protein